MATRKSATSRTKSTTTRARRTTKRTATTTTRRRTSSGALYPRRRTSRPGLPTTVGTAIGTLVVTTLLDLSWPMRLVLIGIVLVIGLAYVLWRHRTEIAAAAEPVDTAGAAPTESGTTDGTTTAAPGEPTPPASPPTTPA